VMKIIYKDYKRIIRLMEMEMRYLYEKQNCVYVKYLNINYYYIFIILYFLCSLYSNRINIQYAIKDIIH